MQLNIFLRNRLLRSLMLQVESGFQKQVFIDMKIFPNIRDRSGFNCSSVGIGVRCYKVVFRGDQHETNKWSSSRSISAVDFGGFLLQGTLTDTQHVLEQESWRKVQEKVADQVVDRSMERIQLSSDDIKTSELPCIPQNSIFYPNSQRPHSRTLSNIFFGAFIVRCWCDLWSLFSFSLEQVLRTRRSIFTTFSTTSVFGVCGRP